MEEGEGGPENPSTWIVDLIAFREIGNSEYNSYFTNLINEIRARPSLEQLDLYLAMLEEAASHEAQNIVREICVLIKDYYYKLSEEKTLALASIHAIAKSLYAKISYPELDDLAKLDSPSKTTSNQGREKETEKEDPKASNNLEIYAETLNFMEALLKDGDKDTFQLAFLQFTGQFIEKDPHEQFSVIYNLTKQSIYSRPFLTTRLYEHLSQIYDLYFQGSTESTNYLSLMERLIRSINNNKLNKPPGDEFTCNNSFSIVHLQNTQPPKVEYNSEYERLDYSKIFNKVNWQYPATIHQRKMIAAYALVHQLICIVSFDNTVYLYNPLTGQRILKKPKNSDLQKTKPVYIASGIVDLQDDNFIGRVLTSDNPDQCITVLCTRNNPSQCLLSDNRDYFICGYDNGRIIVNYIPEHKKANFVAHHAKITGLQLFGEKKEKLLTGSIDGTLKIWNLKKIIKAPEDACEHVRYFDLDSTGPITALASFNGMPISIRGNHLLELWDRSKRSSMTLDNQKANRYNAITSFNDYLVYDIDNQFKVHHKDLGLFNSALITRGSEASVKSFAVSEDKKTLLVHYDNNLLQIYSRVVAQDTQPGDDNDDDVILEKLQNISIN